MTPFSHTHKTNFRRKVTILLALLIASRVVMMICFPHTDTSEARYAEISRKMVETGDWITPQFDYGIPFWAKPPLSMWMSALGIDLFGVNEFGSRIFIFLAAMGILVLVFRAVRRETDANSGLAAAMLLMAMPLFFYCSAAVMTDLALALGTTLAMVCFRAAVLDGSRWHGYGFFVGLAIGLLAKGPLAVVIAIPPVAAWIILTGRWRQSWKSLPWLTGTLLMITLTLPWYLAAENKTPGFLEYFIVGEHWKRFVIKGWQGDLYGNAHSETPGTIWIYLILMTFPWCLGFFAMPFRKWREFRSFSMAHQGRELYWVLWALWPMVFFTPSRNIIATYPLPALPAIAILLAGMIRHQPGEEFSRKRLHPLHPALVTLGIGVLIIAGAMSMFAPTLTPKRTERELVKLYLSKSRNEDRLLYYGVRLYSAEFYSQGEAEQTDSPDLLLQRLESPGRLFLAVKSRSWKKIPPNIQRRFLPLTHWNDKRTNLYIEREDTPPMTGIDATKTYPIGS